MSQNDEHAALVERQVKIIAKAKPLEKQELIDQVKLIKDVLMAVMEPGIHYDIIPGTDKPSLLKPGAEMILLTFRIGIEIITTDFSERANNMIGYRVIVRGIHQPTGVIVGEGTGSCSTDEEKYKWRGVASNEEWEYVGATNRRIKFGKGRNGQPGWSAQQVRTSAADLDNTVLKMAKKRGMVDLALTCTAASQFFGQDIEDLPEELKAMYDSEFQKMREKADSNRSAPRQASGNADKPITEKQAGLLKAKLRNKQKSEAEFLSRMGVKSFEEIPFGKMNDAIALAEE